MYTHIQMDLCIQICTDLFLNITCSVCLLFVFRADQWVLAKQLVCSFLETMSPTQHSLPACSSLCRAEAAWLSPTLFDMSAVVVLAQFMSVSHAVMFASHVGELYGVPRNYNLTANPWVLWALQSSCPLFCSLPKPYLWGCVLYPAGLASTTLHSDWLWFL